MKYQDRVQVLIESLPYIRKFKDSTMVIKYGGHAMVDDGLKHKFAQDIILMSFVGIRPIIVHGGGPQIEMLLNELSIESRFVDGMRITDKRIMDVVEMVLCGKINKQIVSFINHYGGRAIGLSGKDGNLIKAKKITYFRSKDQNSPPEPIDMGMVGEITGINNGVLDNLIEGGFIPVVAPVGAGDKGGSFNINSDTVAGKIAESISARKLILLTDIEGVLDKSGNLISSLTVKEAEELLELGIIKGGMIPKVRCCISAIKNGVKKAHIIDGRKEHALLLEIFTDQGIGTEIVS
jgi:acetylglutamate kinase